MRALLILSAVFLMALPVSPIFCSSACIDYTGPCFDQTPQGCWVCANHIYNMNANLSSSTPCSLLGQTAVLANELANSPSMSLFGYSSSNSVPKTCSNYTFSGEYTNGDYLSKNFTGIPLNHYALVVRFSVGYVGNWSQSDNLVLNLQDGVQSVNYVYRYVCQYPENICGGTGNATDCVRIREYTMTHNSSFVFLNFSALTSESDPLVQWWGVKELIVAAKLCHAYCLTCYGANNSNCLSCAAGYYLQGNVCLPSCENGLYVVADARLCVSMCPQGYYPFINATDLSRSCLKCAVGCLMCSSFGVCQAWSDHEQYVPNLWKDKMEFWILLIIVCVLVVFYGVYRFIRRTMAVGSELEEKLNSSEEKKKSEKGSEKGKEKQKGETENAETKGQESKVEEKDMSNSKTLKSDGKLNLGNDSMVETINQIGRPESNLWFNELVEMEPSEVKAHRGRRRRRSPKELSDVKSNEGIDMTSNVEL